ncbi:sulfite exporter TauE/SafE family protein [Pelomonas sp. Root1444]|uniref:sulfite exporter TauE/SafE family protein n=1 Tax=Pelomonas sp. Root1444 TaxID=1736464 RepID=UPI00070240B3|nr:sulfite exporter TauE/SafE family protein [Pelomonas sp. Root1444]KQY90742.1 permease [Pelomonas sp. Root1444]
MATIIAESPQRILSASLAGAAVGILGGLIGLGGAEFRLPILIGLFGFVALHAVILNKAMSLIVVTSALFFRMGTVPAHEIAANWPSIVNLLGGSLVGAWLGAGWATKLSNRRLYQVISIMLLAIAVVLVFAHGVHSDGPLLHGPAQVVVGLVAGFVIGVVAAVMGVAGGELLIPTLILLFGADIKLAGSLSVAISLPTMVVGFIRFSRDSAFEVLRHNRRFVLAMAVGSVVGAALGGQLLGVVPNDVLLPALAAILVVSAVKVWRHK